MYCLYVLILINQMGSPSEEGLDLFRKTSFVAINSAILLSELSIRFHLLYLGTEVSFFPSTWVTSVCRSGTIFKTFHISLISLQFKDMLKIYSKEAVGRSASCFSTFEWKLSVICC